VSSAEVRGALVAVLVVLASCAPASSPSTDPLAGSPRRTIAVDGQPLDVVVAVDKGRGLAGVDDLGDLDGMLFDYSAESFASRSTFWMQGVRIPLDVAFFGEDRRLIAQLAMPLCPETAQASRACPRYASPAPFRWALETEAGSFPFADGTTLDPGAP
jgi:uncharacterized membrane protein (UPF0127 family)